jgi:sulfhydrogenase subunit beta (sulfur reductase)
VLKLLSATRDGDTFSVRGADAPAQRFAFIGVRACELNAIAIQDRVFLEGRHVDVHYQQRRAGVFIVAVNCATAGGTCFCASMKTGPRAQSGFDLALTELTEGSAQRFLVEAGSAAGATLLAELPRQAAGDAERSAAAAVVERTAHSMGRTMPEEGVPELLRENLEHPRWKDVAGRCLTCGNCTMVCPTCFCTTVEDVGSLAGDVAGRERRWESCFSQEFSYIHGGSVRASAESRYRQWLTHKLSTWVDQFGTSGCVGCGRCISWCPVGIDITEEVKAMAVKHGNT